MSRNDCLFERLSHIVVGVCLFFIAMGLSIVTVVALPVFGFIVAAPVLFLAVWFFNAPRSQECSLR